MKVTEEMTKTCISYVLDCICDADLCAQYKKVQELRELLTVGDCERLSNYFEGGN